MHKKHMRPTCAGIALALLLLTNASARADLLQWDYNWQPSTTKVAANGGGSGGYLSLTGVTGQSATGSSNTVVTNIHTFSTASVANPDVFNQAPISYTMQLTDSASGASSSVTFSGYFNGNLTADSSNVQLTLTSPTTQDMTVGGNSYMVTMGTYTAPGPPGASNAGSLNAFVTVTPGSGTGHIGSVPEPSALLLAGLALPCLGLAGWRKRRDSR